MDAEELLRRYAAGERNFSGVDLSGVNLARGSVPKLIQQYEVGESVWRGRANLSGINLSGTCKYKPNI